MSAMTPRAKIHLAIARDVRGIQNCGGRGRRRLRSLPVNGFPARAIALLATDTQSKAGSDVFVDGGRQSLEIGRVTLQAARDDGPVEVSEAISIARTVDPAQPGPIGHRQLKELVFVPVQVSLT